MICTIGRRPKQNEVMTITALQGAANPCKVVP
jgi:hypothetical protein